MECVSQQVERSHLYQSAWASHGHEVWALGSPQGWRKLAAPIEEHGVVLL